MNNRDKNIVGQVLGKTYRIERFLGAGTVGTVYVARQVRSGGLYAVKILHRKLAASPDLYQRFQDEARLIATLRHPHILPITDFDRDDNGLPFFIMDLLEGENLQQRLKHKDQLPLAQVLEIAQQIGSALHTAHRSGIVHRNIKTENIFLVRHDLGDRVTESTRVMDFGLARFRRLAPAGTRDASLGVSAYMAPETLSETTTPIDGRADQWALSCAVYRMLAGKLPFDDDSPEELLRQITDEPPRPLAKSLDLPLHTVAAISRGMSKRREDRFETMLDFVRALASRSSTGASGEAAQIATEGVPSAKPPQLSGRVTAGMPPLPSGTVGPPPLPVMGPASGEGPKPPATPPQVAAAMSLPSAVPVVVLPSPSRSTPVAAPPPMLSAPPLLIPEGTEQAPVETARPTPWGLIIGGVALLMMGAVGLTLMWERQHQTRIVAGHTVTMPVGESTPKENPVVMPLQGEDLAGTDAGAADGGKGATAQPVIPPIRTATGESAEKAAMGIAPSGVTGGTAKEGSPVVGSTPTAPSTVGPTGATQGSGGATQALPTGTAPAQPGKTATGAGGPSAVAAPAGTGAAPVPTPPSEATGSTGPTVAVPILPVPTTPKVPAMAPTPAAPPTTQAPVVPPPGSTTAVGTSGRTAKDEVDELIGNGSTAGTSTPATAPVAPRPAPTQPATVGTAPRTTPRPAPVSEPTADTAERSADALLSEAQAAYIRGERQRAIDLALQVTQKGSTAEVTRAWRFIGSAACSVRSTTLATKAITNLTSPEHKQMLAELCKRNGLLFQDGAFVVE